jgi:hypothetical protein
MPTTAIAQERCENIKTTYLKEVRPMLVRVIARNPTIANLYLKKLNGVKTASNPTRTEIDLAYRLTLAGLMMR